MLLKTGILNEGCKVWKTHKSKQKGGKRKTKDKKIPKNQPKETHNKQNKTKRKKREKRETVREREKDVKLATQPISPNIFVHVIYPFLH